MGGKTKINLSQITADFIGEEYQLGNNDCFMLVVRYLRKLNANIPDNVHYRGLTLKNYADNYIEDNNIIDYAIEYFLQFCTEVDISKRTPGDILFLEDKEGKFLGIDGGNGKVLTVVRNGVTEVLPQGKYKIRKVLRWQQQEQD